MIQRKKTTKKSSVRRSADTRRATRLWHRWVFGVLFLALIVLSVFCFLFSRSFAIQEISLIGAGDREDAIRTYIMQDVLSVGGDDFFSYAHWGRHIFFVDKDAIIARVVGAFPEVHSIHIDRALPRTLVITVEQHDIIVVACLDGKRTRSTCAMIDNAGIIGRRVDPEETLLTTNKTLFFAFSDGILRKGDRLLAAGIVDHMRTFVPEMPFETGVQVVSDVMITARGESSLRMVTDAGWEAVIDGSRDPRLTLIVLAEFLTKMRSKQEAPTFTEIDLRVKDRVFYKLK